MLNIVPGIEGDLRERNAPRARRQPSTSSRSPIASEAQKRYPVAIAVACSLLAGDTGAAQDPAVPVRRGTTKGLGVSLVQQLLAALGPLARIQLGRIPLGRGLDEVFSPKPPRGVRGGVRGRTGLVVLLLFGGGPSVDKAP